MTNKTTLASDEVHQIAFEEGQPADNGDGYLFTAEEFDLFVQRLFDHAALADPVPPAGGDVEVLGYQVTRVTPTGVARLDRPRLSSNAWVAWEPAFKVAELVDRAHITRLQAEVAQWKQGAQVEADAADEARAELIKVRELLEEPFQLVFEGYNRPGTDFATDAAWATWQHAQLTKAFALLRKVCRPANQSAPADKG